MHSIPNNRHILCMQKMKNLFIHQNFQYWDLEIKYIYAGKHEPTKCIVTIISICYTYVKISMVLIHCQVHNWLLTFSDNCIFSQFHILEFCFRYDSISSSNWAREKWIYIWELSIKVIKRLEYQTELKCHNLQLLCQREVNLYPRAIN